MSVFSALFQWATRPPARERILAAIPYDRYESTVNIIKDANVSLGSFYVNILDMEELELVEGMWGDRTPARGGRRRRLYRRTK